MDTSAESRFVIVAAQAQMAMKYPLGTGHRGTEVLSRDYIDAKYLTVRPDGTPGARASHNTFMTALVEQGIIGAVLFLCMVCWCVAASRQLKRNAAHMSPTEMANVSAIAAALTVILIAGIFVDYIKAEVQIWFLALLASLQNHYARPGKDAKPRSPLPRQPPISS
jgi:O-antigen ligase